MLIGKLRHRVEVQTPTETLDALGQASRTWATTTTRYASILPLTGRELERARQISPDVTHKLTLRNVSITTRDRLLFGTRVFNVQSVLTPEERNLTTEVLAIEKVI